MLTIANLIPLLSLIALGTIFTYAVLLSYNHQFDVLALQPPHLNLVMVNGIAIGDVTAHSAIVWSRTNNEARMHVQYDTDPNFSHPITDQVMQIVNKTTDFSGHMKIDGLRDSTPYYYRVWFSDPNERNINWSKNQSSDRLIGKFITVPNALKSKTINFVIGGDLSGQGYCSRVNIGYSIFSIMKSLSPDFFIFNGDQIYADNSCSAKGPNSNDNVKGWKNIPQYIPSVTANGTNWENLAQLNNIFKLHWEYNRNDTHLKSLLGNTSIYSQADDLEVVNDYGNWSYWTASTKDRSGFPNVAKAGIQAFFNFSPIERNIDEPYRIYRSFNWGKDLDLFILDAHSYRSRSELDDTSSNNKTLLGNTQLRWLEKGLATSNATWKVISGDVPITIPNCFNKQLGCDNWATNSSTYQKTFVRERSNFLKYLDDHNIKNVVFITTDVHFPSNIKIEDDFNHDGKRLVFYELVSGPLSAIPLNANPLDPTINSTYLYKESKIFNFGHITIRKDPSNGQIHLISEIRDEVGLIRPNSELDIIAR